MSISNNLQIRLAEEKDYKNILIFYNRTYQTNRSLSDFIWLVEGNPMGRGIVFIAVVNNQVVGLQSLIPYNFFSNGELVETFKSEDTLVDPSFRGHGIFKKLYVLAIEFAGDKLIWGMTDKNEIFQKVKMKSQFQLTSAILFNNSVKEIFDSTFKWHSKKGLVFLALFIKSRFKVRKSSLIGVNNFGKINLEDNDLRSFIKNLSFDYPDTLFPELSNSILKWRVIDNPGNSNSFMFKTMDQKGDMIAISIITVVQNNAYWLSNYMDKTMSQEEQNIHMNNCVNAMFELNISYVKTWFFNNNAYGTAQNKLYSNIGFLRLRKGMYIVHNSEIARINASSIYFSAQLGLK